MPHTFSIPTLDELKSQLEGYIASELNAFGSDYHSAVRGFASFLEGKIVADQQAESDAIALLEAHGYTVSKSEVPTNS